MRKVFADTFYWAASINTSDDWYDRVLEVTATLDRASIVWKPCENSELQKF